jgi:hypothetical protein
MEILIQKVMIQENAYHYMVHDPSKVIGKILLPDKPPIPCGTQM